MLPCTDDVKMYLTLLDLREIKPNLVELHGKRNKKAEMLFPLPSSRGTSCISLFTNDSIAFENITKKKLPELSEGGE